jgi:hypothetical protein
VIFACSIFRVTSTNRDSELLPTAVPLRGCDELSRLVLFELANSRLEFADAGIVLKHDPEQFADCTDEVSTPGDISDRFVKLIDNPLDVSFYLVSSGHTFSCLM